VKSNAELKPILAGVASGLVIGLIVLLGLFLGPLGGANSNSQASDPTETALDGQPLEDSETPAPTESAEAIQCAVTELEQSAEILDLQAQVIDAATGTVLFDRSSVTPARPASVMKLLTAAAALETLGPNYRVTTRVYADSQDPSILYLVGAGDVTLSRTAPGTSSVYQNAPKLADLARQIASKAPGQTINQIVLDSTLYGSPNGEYQSVWDQRGLTDGYMSYVSALQVDGDRSNPGSKDSARSEDPVTKAGEYFKQALGQSASAAVLSKGVAPADAVEIASVRSAPLSTWIDYMLVVSDNTLAEAIARLVSLEVGQDGSFASLTRAYQIALEGTRINLAGLKVEDGSGLSRFNQVSPVTINDLLKLVDKNYGDFKVILDGMPVSGTPGSLAYRFEDAAGKVVAKTGWIRTGYTLAGFLYPEDGSKLIFTVFNLGNSVAIKNQEAMDELVLGFYGCGVSLVNR
jgi:D-alanyl-D-alanine carboxypeptidase/D-alanyl-D-alanine-endopeptidase (penicillin-binding protein 4)